MRQGGLPSLLWCVYYLLLKGREVVMAFFFVHHIAALKAFSVRSIHVLSFVHVSLASWVTFGKEHGLPFLFPMTTTRKVEITLTYLFQERLSSALV